MQQINGARNIYGTIWELPHMTKTEEKRRIFPKQTACAAPKAKTASDREESEN